MTHNKSTSRQLVLSTPAVVKRAVVLRATATLGAVLVLAAPAWSACDASQPSRKPTDQYVISGETVYDKSADLTWQRCSVGQRWAGTGCTGTVTRMSQPEAKSQASGGWRLPTKEELLSLASPTCRSPAINEEVFPGMEPDKLIYWTTNEVGTVAAWVVLFDGGHAGSDYRSSAYAVRLVRNGR